MQLLVPREVARQLVEALWSAGRREIGGILMAEHIAENTFRVRSLTIQRRGGSVSSFIRIVQAIIEPLRRFFRTTGHNYTRFNYIGEWHSHPSFVPLPSPKDHQTMHEIIEDPEVGALFVVLMIVKVTSERDLEGTVSVYQPGGIRFQGALVIEEQEG